MNKKILACLTVLFLVSVATAGIAYSAFSASIQNTDNIVTINDITAISFGPAGGGGALTSSNNGELSCDLSLSSNTVNGTPTYTFTVGGGTSKTLIDGYVFQILEGAPAATGKITVTLTTAGVDWTGVSNGNITAKANTTDGTLTKANGSLKIEWNSQTIPAYAAEPTSANGIHIVVSLNNDGARQLGSTPGGHDMTMRIDFQ